MDAFGAKNKRCLALADCMCGAEFMQDKAQFHMERKMDRKLIIFFTLFFNYKNNTCIL